MDQGFLENADAPFNTLGTTKGMPPSVVTKYALIGTYCTTNNNGAGGLSDNEDAYTGDFITIAGKLSFKNSYHVWLMPTSRIFEGIGKRAFGMILYGHYRHMYATG